MTTTSAFPGSTPRAVRNVAPWIERLARLGFVASALLYMTVGALATCAALRLAGTPTPIHGKAVGSRGAMGALLAAPAGRVLLVIIAVGLVGSALWRAIDAATNAERHRHGPLGIAARIRSAVIAVVDLGLAYSALRIATGHFEAARDGTETQHWIARALGTPGGTYALYALAAGLVGYGVYQLYCAARAKLDDELSLAHMSSGAARWVIDISRFGIAARGVVFAVTGALVGRAVNQHDPTQAAGPGRTLRELFELGTVPFIVVAIGLVAYGIYELLNAKYRRIHVV
jgi:hypothetical protein